MLCGRVGKKEGSWGKKGTVGDCLEIKKTGTGGKGETMGTRGGQ